MSAQIFENMDDETLCSQIEDAICGLINEGKREVKASDIVNYGNIEEEEYDSSWGVGMLLGYGACDFETIRYEIIRDENDSNTYKIWKED